MKVGEIWKGPEIEWCDLCWRQLTTQAIVSETKLEPRIGVIVCLECFNEECIMKGEELVSSREGWRKLKDLKREV